MNPVGCINDKYRARLARRDWYANVQAPYFEHAVDLVNAKIKSHYVRYFDLTSINIHLIENAPALLQSAMIKAELVETLTAQIEATVRNARTELSSLIARFGKVAEDNGVSAAPKFFQEPLRVAVRIVSPICIEYLEAIQEADEVILVVENLRLRGILHRGECDRTAATVDQLLKSVQRSAFGIAQGLRRRARSDADFLSKNALPNAATPQKKLPTATVFVQQEIEQSEETREDPRIDNGTRTPIDLGPVSEFEDRRPLETRVTPHGEGIDGQFLEISSVGNSA